MSMYPSSILIANRGEIARRVLKTARRLGIRAVVVHHPVDQDLPFVREADEAICLDEPTPVGSYLSIPRILEAAHSAQVEAVHPGYGFLSESGSFARAVTAAGLVWIGPDAETIDAMGDKIEARRLMAAAGVPVGAGSGEALDSIDCALTEADDIGYPVMLKASAGGGGIGMAVARNGSELRRAFESTRARADRSFGSPTVFLERYIGSARHVEVQILGLADGRVVALGERDCSVQRRHQKIAEETPAPGLPPDARHALASAAIRAGETVDYRSAGTVEFLVDRASGSFVFLEMNTRIQVEHAITELVTGVDIVEQQLNIAVGGSSTLGAVPEPHGHAIELRVCAEDPARFFPSPGTITRWNEPSGPGIRVDSGFSTGDVVTSHFDSLLAKLCVLGETRDEAVEIARRALGDFDIDGIATNIPFLERLLVSEPFATGVYDTSIVTTLQSESSGVSQKEISGV
jgi:acetyl-CoA carboxylase biotin carboxylase subunit